MVDQYDSTQRRATLGGGEGDPAGSAPDIRNYVEGEIGNIGNLVFDEGDIPGTATARPNGVYFTVEDLVAYLDGGGLIIRDDTGIIPNPIINILATESEFYDGVEYRVYIDDVS